MSQTNRGQIARNELMSIPRALELAEKMVAGAAHRCASLDRLAYRTWLRHAGMIDRWNGELRLQHVLGFDSVSSDALRKALA